VVGQRPQEPGIAFGPGGGQGRPVTVPPQPACLQPRQREGQQQRGDAAGRGPQQQAEAGLGHPAGAEVEGGDGDHPVRHQPARHQQPAGQPARRLGPQRHRHALGGRQGGHEFGRQAVAGHVAAVAADQHRAIRPGQDQQIMGRGGQPVR
jgi:hypothetical protein